LNDTGVGDASDDLDCLANDTQIAMAEFH